MDIFYGSQLRLARLFQGKTLQELADIVGTTRQYIQQLESNVRIPNSDIIEALAQILEVNINFFSKSDFPIIADDLCHFRSLKATTLATRRQAIAHGTMFEKFCSYLDQVLELPKINFPRYCDINNVNDIEKAAEECRRKWNLGTTTPITNMIRVLENAGALITCFKSISEKIDAFSMEMQRPLIIRNPFKESICRLRFDLAHECGHLVMHKGIETGDSETEKQANRFASAFLLPRSVFFSEFSFLKTSKYISWQHVYEKKLRWKVSSAAIIRRAYDLGLIDAVKYRSANIYLKKTGQSKKEEYDDIIEPEKPELISTALDVLRDDGRGALLQITQSLKIEPLFLKKLLGDVTFFPNDFEKGSRESNIIYLHNWK